MITQVTTQAQKEAFRERLRGKISLEPMMAVPLDLFWEKPGSGFGFYLTDTGALMVQGSLATLAGIADPEELDSFLSFLGIHRLVGEMPPEGWEEDQTLTAFQGMGPLSRPVPAGTRLVKEPSLNRFAQLVLEGKSREEQENFYAQVCIRANHGRGQFWALAGEEGTLLSGVGAFAIEGEWAYLSQGYTRPDCRGRGLGGWLIAALGRDLANQGKTPCLLCLPNRKALYARLGMRKEKEYYLYNKRE